MSEWRTDRPPEHGYYLGAWRRGDGWAVSELWFNPDSHGSGWWSSRGYLGDRHEGHETIPVEAWMPMPAYEPAPDGEQCGSCGKFPARHTVFAPGHRRRLCCYCYVGEGKPPADWHPRCLEAAKIAGLPSVPLQSPPTRTVLRDARGDRQ